MTNVLIKKTYDNNKIRFHILTNILISFLLIQQF